MVVSGDRVFRTILRPLGAWCRCHFQKTTALNVRSRLHYSRGRLDPVVCITSASPTHDRKLGIAALSKSIALDIVKLGVRSRA